MVWSIERVVKLESSHDWQDLFSMDAYIVRFNLPHYPVFLALILTMPSDSSTSTLAPDELTSLLTRTSSTLTEDAQSTGYSSLSAKLIGRELLLLLIDSTPGTSLSIRSSLLLTRYRPDSRVLLCFTALSLHGCRGSGWSVGSRRAVHRSVQLDVDLRYWQVPALIARRACDPILFFAGFVVALGGSTALDTLGSQAFTGGKRATDLSVHFLRSIVVLWTSFLPIAILWINAEPILLALGQERYIARGTQSFLRVMILGMPAYIAFESLKKYLQCQGRPLAARRTQRVQLSMIFAGI